MILYAHLSHICHKRMIYTNLIINLNSCLRVHVLVVSYDIILLLLMKTIMGMKLAEIIGMLIILFLILYDKT